MSFDADRYVVALRFAATAHRDQRVPGTDLPYVVHVVTVCAEVVASFAPEPADHPDLAITCALLHDTLEDTSATADEVRAAFGDAVLAGVQALTKDPSLPKDRRMDDSLDRILRCPPEIARVKLADRITNLAPPPPHWNPEKCTAYRAEAVRIVDRLGHASPVLAARLRARIADYTRFCGWLRERRP
jgi:(p)ppGpp synthase/HD superfamily hydrolase